MHFQTYVDMNCFCYLHMRNSFLKLCRVFLKHPVCIEKEHTTDEAYEFNIQNRKFY
jgi:hypothetical protein